MPNVQTLNVARGCFVEFDGRSIKINYMLTDVRIGEASTFPLSLIVPYELTVGQRVDASIGPYTIAARVEAEEGASIVAVEVQRPQLKPMRFYLDRSAFELDVAELESESDEVIQQAGPDGGAPTSPTAGSST